MLVGFFVLLLHSESVQVNNPFSSSLWTRPLRYRLMRRWSFSHVDFCAGGGRFLKTHWHPIH